ncbi:hypothetical protein SLA2020_446920 [Shorea laevis]
MARVVAQKGLNPYAPEFIPTLYPLLTTSSPDHHYYLPAPPDTFFCYHSPSLRTFSSSQTFYTNLCFPTTQPASLLLPPPQKDLVSVIEPTIAFVAERPPEEAAHAPQNDAVVEHKMVATKKTSPRRYRNQYYGGRGGAWAWWERMVTCGVRKTTIMIRNIPSKYTRNMLVEFLDNHCMLENQKAKTHDNLEEHIVSAFDFVYLPIDFRTGCNKGYAFVNFTDPRAVWKFYLAADKQTWGLFHSNKIREIAYARLQGEELLRHFESMGFPCESVEVLPVCFSPPRDGSKELVKERRVGKCTGIKRPLTIQI